MEEVQPFGQQQCFLIHQEIKNSIGAQRRIRHDEIGAGAMQCGYVAVFAGAAENLHIRPQAAQIFCEINIGGVVMRCDQGSGRFFKPGFLQSMNVGGIPIYEMRIILIFPAAFSMIR